MAHIAILLWIACAVLIAIMVPNDRLAASSISPVLIVAGLAAIYGIVVPLDLVRRQQTYLLGIDYKPWFWGASAVSALSAMCFCIGYLFLHHKQRPVALTRRNPWNPLVLASLEKWARRLAILATLLFLYRVARYGLGGWAIRLSEDRSSLAGATAYITYAPQYLAGVTLFLWHTSPKPVVRYLSVLVLVGVTFYFFASGVRYLVIVMMGSAALLYYWKHGRRITPPLRYLTAALVAGFLVLGVGGQLRTRSMGGTAGIRESAKDSFEISLPMAGLMAYTERTGYILGTSYTYIAYQVIPRSVWPSKPLPPTYVAIADYTDIEEGRSFPLWGELFLNFGWYGVAGGMILFGYAMHRWLRYWLENRHRLLTLDVIAAITIPLIVQWVSRGLFVQLVYNTMGLIIGPLLLLLHERRLRRRAGHLRDGTDEPVVAPALHQS